MECYIGADSRHHHKKERDNHDSLHNLKVAHHHSAAIRIRADKHQNFQVVKQQQQQVVPDQEFELFYNEEADDLGYIVNKVVGKKELFDLEYDPIHQQKRWQTVLLTLATVFIAFHATSTAIIKLAIEPSIPTPNFDKNFDEFENPFEEIAEDFVPYAQDWFLKWQKETENDFESEASLRGHSRIKSRAGLLASSMLSQHSLNSTSRSNTGTDPECLENYFKDLRKYIPTSSPSYIRLILNNLGDHMSRNPIIIEYLKDFLAEPQDLLKMYDESQSCLGESIPFVALACAANEKLGSDPLNLEDLDTQIIFRYGVNMSLVIEMLTKYLEKDFAAFSGFVESMMTSRRKEVENYYERKYAKDEDTKKFLIAKYRSLTSASKLVQASKELNEVPRSNQDPNFQMQMNIIEAVVLDLQNHNGVSKNARAGLAVAAAARIGMYIESGSSEVLDKVGKEFIDAYLAWNFVFISTNLQNSYKVGKLLIPSIACSRDPAVAERFIQRRTISLSLGLTLFFSQQHHDDESIQEMLPTPKEMMVLKKYHLDDDEGMQMLPADLSDALGQSNIEHFMIVDPDQDTVSKMLYNLCGQFCHGASLKMTSSSLLSGLDEDQFIIYAGFVMWITMVVTGTVIEMFMLLRYEKFGWSKRNQYEWMLAQFLSTILMLVSIGLAKHGNYLSLITTVLAGWKFGYPETVIHMYCVFFDSSLSRSRKFCHFVESVGTIIHHSSASLTVPMALIGVIAIDRSVLDVSLIICFQHLIVLLKYFQNGLYVFLEILLEVWLDWTILSNYEYYISQHWTLAVVANGLLFSHWLWFISGSVTFLIDLWGPKEGRGVSTTPSSDASVDDDDASALNSE